MGQCGGAKSNQQGAVDGHEQLDGHARSQGTASPPQSPHSPGTGGDSGAGRVASKKIKGAGSPRLPRHATKNTPLSMEPTGEEADNNNNNNKSRKDGGTGADGVLCVSPTPPPAEHAHPHSAGTVEGMTASRTAAGFESMVSRLDAGSTYVWLRFSHANPNLAARPLVPSTDTVVQAPLRMSATSGLIQNNGGASSAAASATAMVPVLTANTEENGKGKATSSAQDARCFKLSGLREGSVFARRPGEIRGRRFVIQDSERATVLLLDVSSSISIANCTNCFFFLGPTVGTVELVKCRGCVVVSACGQIRLQHCRRMILSLLTAGLPTLENCTVIGVTSLSGWYAYSEMPIHLQAAHLSPFINNYSTVRDTTPSSAAGGGGGGGKPSNSASFALGRPGAAAAAAAMPRNFFYLDPWSFDLSIWRHQIAVVLCKRGLWQNVNSAHPSHTPKQLRGNGADAPALTTDTSDSASTSSLHSAVTCDGDKSTATRTGRPTSTGNESPSPSPPPRRPARSPATAFKEPESMIPLGEDFNLVEASETRNIFSDAPHHLLDLPIATASKDAMQQQQQQQSNHKDAAAAGELRLLTTATKLPPMSPRSVEDVLSLYSNAIVSPATLGATLIPKCFFRERWRLKLFVVCNKNGGWDVAQRIARDIELARRQTFLEYARTVPLPTSEKDGHGKSAAAAGSSAAAAEGEDADPYRVTIAGLPSSGDPQADAKISAHEYHYVPLSQRCGPVLLLNTVELRCTDTVMREYVAPTFYKLTEPAGVKDMTRDGTAATSSSNAGSEGRAHAHRDATEKDSDPAEVQRSVAVRRLFGEAIQRMSGQACVFLLALVDASEDEKRAAVRSAEAAAEANAIVSAARRRQSAGTPSSSDRDEDAALQMHSFVSLPEDDVGDDNVLALSQAATRHKLRVAAATAAADRVHPGSGGGGVGDNAAGLAAIANAGSIGRTKLGTHALDSLALEDSLMAPQLQRLQQHGKARWMHGARIFQPLSLEEEEAQEAEYEGIGNSSFTSSASSVSLAAESMASSLSASFASQSLQSVETGECDVAEGKRRDGRRRHRRGGGGGAARDGSPALPGDTGAPLPSAMKKTDRDGKHRKRHHKKRAHFDGNDNGSDNRSGALFMDDSGAAERSREERVWPRCVVLNVTVPIQHVSLLQKNVFFKASLMSVSTSHGFAAPPG